MKIMPKAKVEWSGDDMVLKINYKKYKYINKSNVMMPLEQYERNFFTTSNASTVKSAAFL